MTSGSSPFGVTSGGPPLGVTSGIAAPNSLAMAGVPSESIELRHQQDMEYEDSLRTDREKVSTK